MYWKLEQYWAYYQPFISHKNGDRHLRSFSEKFLGWCLLCLLRKLEIKTSATKNLNFKLLTASNYLGTIAASEWYLLHKNWCSSLLWFSAKIISTFFMCSLFWVHIMKAIVITENKSNIRAKNYPSSIVVHENSLIDSSYTFPVTIILGQMIVCPR